MSPSPEPMVPLLHPRRGSVGQVFQLAYPVVLTQLSITMMGVVDAAIVGRLGATELASVGFAGIWLMTAFNLFFGTASGVQTFISQEDGAGAERRCGPWEKGRQNKKDTDTVDSDVKIEAEILPEATAARKVEHPRPTVISSAPKPPAPAISLPPPVLPAMKSVLPPPPTERTRRTARTPRGPAQESLAKAAYKQQVEPARPPRTRTTPQPVTPNRTNLPPDVRVLRRLLADRTGQRAAVALCEVLGPPIALRDSHLER